MKTQDNYLFHKAILETTKTGNAETAAKVLEISAAQMSRIINGKSKISLSFRTKLIEVGMPVEIIDQQQEWIDAQTEDAITKALSESTTLTKTISLDVIRSISEGLNETALEALSLSEILSIQKIYEERGKITASFVWEWVKLR